MTEELNLLKLVADLGSKIEAAKGKIAASEQVGDKWKANFLETQKALSERKLQVLKLRVRLSSEKEQLAEKEEKFNSCLTEVQSDLERLTTSRSWVAQSRLQLSSVRQQQARLTQLSQQHAAANQAAAEHTEPAQQLVQQQQRRQQLQEERARLESTLRGGAAQQSARQRTAAGKRSRADLQRRLQERHGEEQAQQNTADRLQAEIQQKQAQMAAEQQTVAVRLSRASSQQSLENERLRAIELRAAQVRSQLEESEPDTVVVASHAPSNSDARRSNSDVTRSQQQ